MTTPTRTQIGSSAIEVSPLVLGGNVFGWTAGRDESFAVLDAFVAGGEDFGGGDFIDTADGYSAWAAGNEGGESETIIGEWLSIRGARDLVTIATKVSTHPNFRGLAAANIRAAADASLARLGTDRIDLYYAHYDDQKIPLEETVAAFSALVDAGKIRAIGVSNYTAERVAEWCEIARVGGYHLPVALQPHYNLVERGFETNGLREVAQREGLAVFPYYSLAEGFLAGTYRTAADVTADDASARAEDAAEHLNDRGLAVLAALDGVAAAHTASGTLADTAEGAPVQIATVALAWLRNQPTVIAPIVSARTVAQLPALLASMTLELSHAEIEALNAESA
jgi:aryl-alcohol dehydrogenase-like predicted oxidoreductase